jgi:hypothetical protein
MQQPGFPMGNPADSFKSAKGGAVMPVKPTKLMIKTLGTGYGPLTTTVMVALVTCFFALFTEKKPGQLFNKRYLSVEAMTAFARFMVESFSKYEDKQDLEEDAKETLDLIEGLEYFRLEDGNLWIIVDLLTPIAEAYIVKDIFYLEEFIKLIDLLSIKYELGILTERDLRDLNIREVNKRLDKTHKELKQMKKDLIPA